MDSDNSIEKEFYPFSNQNFYRYLDLPSDNNENINLLDYFFGPDRSYRIGCPFDDGDVIIEFNFKDINKGLSISHHPLSYRGNLNINDINIINIYVNNRTDYFISNKHLDNYRLKIKNLLDSLPLNYKCLVKFYDELNDNYNNDHYLVYNGLNRYI